MRRPFYNDSGGNSRREFVYKPRGTIGVESTQIRWFSRWSDEEAELHDQWPKQLKGGHHAPFYSDQMVLVMARQGGWTTVMKWPKNLKSKLNLKGDY
jgi:hypothetical protein